MLSKAKIKLIQSLQHKKYRDEHRLFLAEGNKICPEVLKSNAKIQYLIALPSWLESNNPKVSGYEIIETDEAGMKKVSQLAHPQEVMMVIEKPDHPWIPLPHKTPIIVLDGIRDPGNLGTIIRLADWFGYQKIVLSKDSVDYFNPKVIQASMGSFLRIDWSYFDLPDYFSTLPQASVYGTFMDGKSLFRERLSDATHFVLGNEGQGISEQMMPFIHRRISIPSHPLSIAESLNVATASAILLSELYRQGG